MNDNEEKVCHFLVLFKMLEFALLDHGGDGELY